MSRLIKKIKLRLRWWKSLVKKVGKEVMIANSATIYSPENVEVGDYSIVNDGVLLNARAPIHIGSYVHISPGAILNTGGLEYRKIRGERQHLERPIVLEDGVWVGSGAIINPGVSIGQNSVIGAGAVVTSDIPADSVAVGVPARVIKKIYD